MSRQPLVMEKCTSQLWEGVECDLPAGHNGSHHRAGCADGAALSWRSSVSARVPSSASQHEPAMVEPATLAR